jgi:hypothetical protein
MKGLGAFDDDVVEYLDGNSTNKHTFIKLKRKLKQCITMQQLVVEIGNFSLHKYYDLYIQVENTFNCSEEAVKMDGRLDESLFIIYTNTDDASDLKSNKVTDVGVEEFLTTCGSVM